MDALIRETFSDIIEEIWSAPPTSDIDTRSARILKAIHKIKYRAHQRPEVRIMACALQRTLVHVLIENVNRELVVQFFD
jgi:hypothetical protein